MKDEFPSNIPPSHFSNAFINAVEDLYKISLDNTGESLKMPDILEGTETGKFIKTIVKTANGDIQKAKTYLEEFYKSAMDEMTKFYRKKVKYFSFFFALIIAVTLNVDTINVANNLWHNPAAREAASAQISSILKSNDSLITSMKTNSSVIDSTKKKVILSNSDSIKVNMANISKSDSILKLVPLPIGWSYANYPHNDFKKVNFLAWLIPWLAKLLGMLITAVAIMMGAPFWFDLLNRITGLKESLKK